MPYQNTQTRLQDILVQIQNGQQKSQIVNSTGDVVGVSGNALDVNVTIAGADLSVGGGVEAGALLVTIASDSTGVLSIDDNGANLSIDFAGVAPQLDDTDKLAVSLYANSAAAGDTSLNIGTGLEDAALLVTIATNAGLPAGENFMGAIGGITGVTSDPVVMTVAGAYATGDYIGVTTAPNSFVNALRIIGGTGVLKSIVISDKDIATPAVAMELWLFSATFTAPTDNAAWSISDADAANCIGVIPLLAGNWHSSALNKVYTDDTMALPVSSATADIFYALVARGTTPTWTSLDLQVTIGVLQD
jgi:hypothetical protein